MIYNMTSCSSQPNYNLEDFGRIINDGFHFELSTNVIDMISSISEKVKINPNFKLNPFINHVAPI